MPLDVQAEDVVGVRVRVVGRRGVFDAARLTPATGLDLGFDHDGTADFRGDRSGLFGVVGHPARRGRHAPPDEQFFRLILEKIHDHSVVDYWSAVVPGPD